ncbi:MAG: RNA polymerase factor sigma-54 [Bacteroidota bacterium]|nr:RNA polymerase factor sigma-54 [Bacteroidota bacterium]
MLELRQELKLQQKLSPQQIQFIKLLQLPTLAMEQRIQQELEVNPLLEEVDLAADLPTEEAPEDAASEDDFTWEDLLPSGDELYGHKARVDRDEAPREIPLAARDSFTDRLRDQKAYLGFTQLQALIAEQIIGSIDDDGYLRRPLLSIVDDLSFNHGQELDEHDVLEVLRAVQRLEPVGIAARSLQECLLVQLEVLSQQTPGRELAMRMIRERFDDFKHKRFERLMQRFEVDHAALKEALDLIQQCNPKPGEGASAENENYVMADFSVDYAEGQFAIRLNSGNAPELRISRAYRTMLKDLSHRPSNKPEQRGQAETRKFLRHRFESARWFIDSVRQRRHTLMAVMREIVACQQEFFIHGIEHLRPMILKDIADRVEMDISTISRVVSGKYLRCAYGVFELKYFFSEGVSTVSGERVSNKKVHTIILDMVRDEDKSAPLSDQRIADQLKEQGYQIARRTVTKYREHLNIPVARLRREIVAA